jgi:hypothetical protein
MRHATFSSVAHCFKCLSLQQPWLQAEFGFKPNPKMQETLATALNSGIPFIVLFGSTVSFSGICTSISAVARAVMGQLCDLQCSALVTKATHCTTSCILGSQSVQ